VGSAELDLCHALLLCLLKPDEAALPPTLPFSPRLCTNFNLALDLAVLTDDISHSSAVCHSDGYLKAQTGTSPHMKRAYCHSLLSLHHHKRLSWSEGCIAEDTTSYLPLRDEAHRQEVAGSQVERQTELERLPLLQAQAANLTLEASDGTPYWHMDYGSWFLTRRPRIEALINVRRLIPANAED
jgi:hypothetical protein